MIAEGPESQNYMILGSIIGIMQENMEIIIIKGIMEKKMEAAILY